MTPLSQYATRVRDGVLGGRRHLDGLVAPVHRAQNAVLANVFRPYGVIALYWSFAIVFFYFGFQKPSPAQSPVRVPLTDFLPVFGIPVDLGMVFIGTYEMFLGLLFFFRQLRAAFWLFVPHQAVTFLTLVVVPSVTFQPPYLLLFGHEIPWATTGFGEFVVKNLVFVAAFMLLVSVELGGEGDHRDVEDVDDDDGDGDDLDGDDTEARGEGR